MVGTQELQVYKGKRVFVTGDTGFKGSWLCMWLLKLGAEVLGYALPPERDHDHFNLLSLGRSIMHVEADIRDYNKLSKTINEFRPEFVFHLAAQSLVRLSYEQPLDTFDTNIGGSVRLLEAVRHCPNVKSVIYVTTDKCYWNQDWVWGYRENDPLGGHDPYSASKAAAEMCYTAYLESFFKERANFGSASVRAGNVIGGGDWAKDRIVPDCINSLQNKQAITLRYPMATRPWQHVLEPLYGYLLLGARLYQEPKRYSGSWNFGPCPESICTVEELTKEIVYFWGDGKIEISIPHNAYHEAHTLHLNCDKAHHLLNWYPCWDLASTLRHTVTWYKQVGQGCSAADLTGWQIDEYMAELNQRNGVELL
jgi:CDP-glucose 4,6-dehydratase